MRFYSSENRTEDCLSLNRTLPECCRWYTSTPTRKYYRISRYRVSESEKELKDVEELIDIHALYEYKDSWFNPWLQNAIFEFYLKTRGLPGVQAVSLCLLWKRV